MENRLADPPAEKHEWLTPELTDLNSVESVTDGILRSPPTGKFARISEYTIRAYHNTANSMTYSYYSGPETT